MNHALVVGGGPAGAALATRLALAGRRVLLLERTEGPTDKVCGEFISGEAATYIERLGVNLAALGAVPITSVRLCTGGRQVTVPLPFKAHSLSRRVLDEVLLSRAVASGATVRRSAKVERLEPCDLGWTARLDSGEAVHGESAFLATGKHDLRGHPRPPGLQNDLVAFKLHRRLAPLQAAQLDQHVELALFSAGYAGLQPVEGGRANLCLVVRRERLRALGSRWENLLETIRRESPHLDARLGGAEPSSERPLALSAIPYGHVRRRGDALFRLGDQAAVIPSFSGDGMSIALHSAALAADTFLRGGSADEYQQKLARDVRTHVFLATALSQQLVRPAGQAVLGWVARAWPELIRTVATHTRVPGEALAQLAR